MRVAGMKDAMKDVKSEVKDTLFATIVQGLTETRKARKLLGELF